MALNSGRKVLTFERDYFARRWYLFLPVVNKNDISHHMQPFDRLSIQFRSLWCYKANPLICPKCRGTMRIISFIEDRQVIRAILEHLGIWLVRARPPPKIHCLPVCIHNAGRSAAPSITDDVSQIPAHADHFYGDPQYSWDDYIQA